MFTWSNILKHIHISHTVHGCSTSIPPLSECSILMPVPSRLPYWKSHSALIGQPSQAWASITHCVSSQLCRVFATTALFRGRGKGWWLLVTPLSNSCPAFQCGLNIGWLSQNSYSTYTYIKIHNFSNWLWSFTALFINKIISLRHHISGTALCNSEWTVNYWKTDITSSPSD